MCYHFAIMVHIVYKLLRSGRPSYISPFLLPCSSKFNTKQGRLDQRFQQVPQFCPSLHKSEKQFGHSFALDACTIWNEMSDDICSASSATSFRRKLRYHICLPKPLHHSF